MCDNQCPYPRIIESEAIEGKLEVEIFVNLLIRCVNVALVVASVVRASLVEEPVEEVTANETKAFWGDGVASTVVTMIWRLTWLDAIVHV